MMGCHCWGGLTCSVCLDVKLEAARTEEVQERVDLKRQLRMMTRLNEALLDEADQFRGSTRISEERHVLLERVAMRTYHGDDRPGILDMQQLRAHAAVTYDVLPGEPVVYVTPEERTT